MQKNLLLIDIPKFEIEYGEEELSYTKKKGKENLNKVLYEASRQYCMYCYSRIQIDNRRFGHLEHAIERMISPEKLTNCIPNIGLSCGYCNDKYKKRHEKSRKPDNEVLAQFEKAECKDNCKAVCREYQDLKKNYLSKDGAQIILQPLGVVGEETGLELLLQYDILEGKFIPSQNKPYSEKEKSFIWDHINRFHLNEKQERTRQLIRFVEDTIEHNGEYSKLEYNNLIVELFVKQVLQGKKREEILKICRLIYSYSFVKFST